MLRILALAGCSLLSDNNFMDKNVVDLNAPPLTYPVNKIEEQLLVIPKILEIIAKFAMNNDLLLPERASDFLMSIATSPFKLFQAKELIAKIRVKEFYYVITRTDRFEASVLVRRPDPVINVVVALYFRELKTILKDISGSIGAGEQIYFIMGLSDKVYNWNFIKDLLKIV